MVLLNIDLVSLNLSQCFCPGEAPLNVWADEVLMFSLWIALLVLMIGKLFTITSRLHPSYSSVSSPSFTAIATLFV